MVNIACTFMLPWPHGYLKVCLSAQHVKSIVKHLVGSCSYFKCSLHLSLIIYFSFILEALHIPRLGLTKAISHVLMSPSTTNISSLLFLHISQEALKTSLYMEFSFYFDKATVMVSVCWKLNPKANDVELQCHYKPLPAAWTEAVPCHHTSGLHMGRMHLSLSPWR